MVIAPCEKSRNFKFLRRLKIGLTIEDLHLTQLPGDPMKLLLNLLAAFMLISSPTLLAAEKGHHKHHAMKKHECKCTKECKEKCKDGKAKDCQCKECDCGKKDSCEHCSGHAHEEKAEEHTEEKK